MAVRFSESELGRLSNAAGLAGSALAAWIGETALRVAEGRDGDAGAAVLLRLHADVVALASCAADPEVVAEARRIQVRVGAALDAVIVGLEKRRGAARTRRAD